jgi:hypothetical protein
MIIKRKINLLLTASISTLLSFSLNAANVGYRNAMKAQLMLPQLELSSVNNRQEKVQFSQIVTSSDLAKLKKTFPVVKSQQYFMRVTGAELNKGLSIDTSAAGALVRISPTKNSNASPIKVEELNVTTPSGNKMAAVEAMAFKANSHDLQATPFPEGTSVFKFETQLGAGQFKISTTRQLMDEEEFIVNVLEKKSPYQLKLETNSHQYFAGQNFAAKIKLNNLLERTSNVANSFNKNVSKSTKITSVKGKLVAPDGREFSAEFSANKNGDFSMLMPMNLPLSAAQGLWEVNVSTQGKNGSLLIKRDARLAFAYSPVTAVVESVSMPKKFANKHIQSNVNVTVQYAGRYEVKGILYGKLKGRLAPVMETRIAMWLEVGDNQVPLIFDKAGQHLNNSAANSWVVKNVVLTDQSRMSVFPQNAQMLPVIGERPVIVHKNVNKSVNQLTTPKPSVMVKPKQVEKQLQKQDSVNLGAIN